MPVSSDNIWEGIGFRAISISYLSIHLFVERYSMPLKCTASFLVLQVILSVPNILHSDLILSSTVAVFLQLWECSGMIDFSQYCDNIPLYVRVVLCHHGI